MSLTDGSSGELSPHGNLTDSVIGPIRFGETTINHEHEPKNANVDADKALQMVALSGEISGLIAQIAQTPVHASGELHNAINDLTEALRALSSARTPADVAHITQHVVANAVANAAHAKQAAQGEAGFEKSEIAAEFYGETYVKIAEAFDKEWAILEDHSIRNNAVVNSIAEKYNIDLSSFDKRREELKKQRDEADNRVDKALISVDIAANDVDAADKALEEAKKLGASATDIATLEKTREEAQRLLIENQKLAQKEIEAEREANAKHMAKLENQREQAIAEGHSTEAIDNQIAAAHATSERLTEQQNTLDKKHQVIAEKTQDADSIDEIKNLTKQTRHLETKSEDNITSYDTTNTIAAKTQIEMKPQEVAMADIMGFDFTLTPSTPPSNNTNVAAAVESVASDVKAAGKEAQQAGITEPKEAESTEVAAKSSPNNQEQSKEPTIS